MTKRFLLCVGAFVFFSCWSRAEFVSSGAYDNGEQLAVIVDTLEMIRQGIFWIVGLLLVRLTVHGWRV